MLGTIVLAYHCACWLVGRGQHGTLVYRVEIERLALLA